MEVERGSNRRNYQMSFHLGRIHGFNRSSSFLYRNWSIRRAGCDHNLRKQEFFPRTLRTTMPRLSRRTFLASTVALAFHSVRGDEPRKRFPFFEPVSPPRAAQVMAHRGMAMLAPENTRMAVEACARDYVEWA